MVPAGQSSVSLHPRKGVEEEEEEEEDDDAAAMADVLEADACEEKAVPSEVEADDADAGAMQRMHGRVLLIVQLRPCAPQNVSPPRLHSLF